MMKFVAIFDNDYKSFNILEVNVKNLKEIYDERSNDYKIQVLNGNQSYWISEYDVFNSFEDAEEYGNWKVNMANDAERRWAYMF